MSNCDVCIGTDSYDPAEFYNESFHVARTEKQCCECRETIAVGSRYFRAIGKWEGVFASFIQCTPCREIQIVFACGQGYMFEQLWEDMFDVVFEHLTVRSSCFNQLSIEARAKVTEQWWRWKEQQR